MKSPKKLAVIGLSILIMSSSLTGGRAKTDESKNEQNNSSQIVQSS